MTKASEHQPDPQPGKQIVVDIVLADIRERAEAGKLKYGTYLETNNGRDPLWDAYQEALDLVMYLRQAILEKEQDFCECSSVAEILIIGSSPICPACGLLRKIATCTNN